MTTSVSSAKCSEFEKAPSVLEIYRVLCVVILFFLAIAAGPMAYGQATASFSGNVTDTSGSALVGADVKVSSAATGLTRVIKTDRSGHYVIPLLPVGIYTVRVDDAGFQSAASVDQRLQIDESREVNFSLSPASVQQSVLVTADAVSVETGGASLGQVITAQQVSQLPLNGRDFVQLATLTSGATAETNTNSFFTAGSDSEVAARGSFSLSVGGSRPNATDWLLDGVDNNELTGGGIGVFSSIDDIQEFKVLTYTYSAEFGTRAGPTVLVTTKSGTNQFHGSLFEFVRNTNLDAKSALASAREKFNLNQFGGAVGGPIFKDKTFFFVDGEQKYQRHGIAFTGLVPSLAMRSGDFSENPFGVTNAGLVIANPNVYGVTPRTGAPSPYWQCDGSGNPLPTNADGTQANGTPCNKIPRSQINNIGQALLNIYPAPNVNFGSTTAAYNYVAQPVRSLNETKFDVRIDHNLSSNDSAFARFSYDQAFSHVPGGGPGLAEGNAFGSNEDIRNHARNVALSETHIFSPTKINQFTFGYNRIFDYIASQGNGTCASANIVPGGIPGANLGCTGTSPNATCLPGAYSCGLTSTLLTGGYWSLGDRGYSPFQGGTNVFTYKDSVDLILHKHELKVGIDFRANQMNVGTEAFQDGFWVIGAGGYFSGAGVTAGDAEADVLTGFTGLAEHDQTFQGSVTGRRWKIIRPFVQDDWRVTPSLTINAGLAYALTTPITEARGRLANYNLTTGVIEVANKNGVSSSANVNMDWTTLEPRVGVAWKVLGSEKTVLRAGYSLYHDSAWSQGAQGLWQNPPFLGETDAFQPAGCAFATSYCATVLGATPASTTIATGFQTLSAPPTASSFTGSFYSQPHNFKQGRVQQFNANLERQVLGNTVLTAGYAGSRGTHILISGNDLNVASPSGCGTIANYTIGCEPGGAAYVPSYPTTNAIFPFNDIGKTNYDSLQIKAETKNPRHGLYALVAYTYSHTYDNGLSDGLGSELSAPYFPLPNWQSLDWSLSQINLNHNFTGSVIYDLPFGRGRAFGSNWSPLTNSIVGGFQLTLIEHATSGFPVPLINSNNASGVSFQNGGNGNNFNRPDQVAGCNTNSANHSQHQWINAACFPASAPGELGNAARVPVAGPDFWNTDFSVIKQFALPVREMGFNLRFEFFNLFNHPQYGPPASDISQPGFGAVTSTVNNPRVIQLAAKLTF
jgi:hypothetical protein